MTVSIRPTRIDVPQSDLDDLQARLNHTRLPEELPAGDGDPGLPLPLMRELIARWRDEFDWRRVEADLNRSPQFLADIEGEAIHFFHIRSPRPDAIPLLVTHGWPNTAADASTLFEPLTRPTGSDPAFHLVVPSLPGFGFSGPTKSRGWTPARIARAWATLMRDLGYERYGLHGGDWGTPISLAVAENEPDRVIGVHLTYLPTPRGTDVIELTSEDENRLAHLERYVAETPGYWRMQSTRPLTLAYALADSPVGQLAWIADRMIAWSDPNHPPEPDVILRTASIYWLMKTAASSSMLHFDSGGARGGIASPTAPLGVSVFAHDLVLPVRRLAERRFNVQFWSEWDRGGHFPALDVPEAVTADLRAFFRSLSHVG